VAGALLAVTGLLPPIPASASPETDVLKEEVRRLQQRIDQLERKERRTGGTQAEDLKERVDDLEGQVQVLKKPGKIAEALDGVTAGAAFTMVGQRATRGTADGRAESQLNYRADIEVEIPGDTFGKLAGIGDSRLFAHFRAGQGAGLARLNPTLTGTPNSIGFALNNSDDSAAILAQAWYQLGLPLDPGASGRLPRVEFTIGKIDLFGFFDQNDVADDESEGFLNNVFVHNPLLDSGGDIGADSYGFAPGAILSYTNDVNSVNRWKLSFGAFGAGSGAGFDSSFSRPLAIAQAEYTGRVLRNRPGTYRAYAWSNGRTVPFANEFDPTEERHSGWGLSLDQEVARYTSVFARYGQSTRGQVKFDRAFTLGAQMGGYRWGRAQDRVGLALGWLDPSEEFRAAAPGLDADGDGSPDFGFGPTGAETSVELFYAWQINKTFQLTPSWQLIGRPGGDAAAEDISIFSVRAKAAF
jgi:hypothetical protein